MLLRHPHSLRAVALALVFGLAFGAVASTPAVWTAPQSRTSAPVEEEDESQKSETKATTVAERRSVKPCGQQADPVVRAQSIILSPSVAFLPPAPPAAALNNGLSAHYRC